ncbi:MAG: M20/M25/M40 family metallo-hydrolase [Candidatus Hodarchaeota archaeon]
MFFKGSPGHGSMPYASDNAIVKAGKATARLIDYCDNKIPITTEYLEHLAKGFGLNLFSRFMLTNKRTLAFTLRKLEKKNPAMAKFIHALSRMTISPNMTRGGTKINVIPAKASIDVDVRILPGQDEKYVITHLKKALGDLADEAEIETFTDAGGIHSYGNSNPASSDFVNAMEKAIQQIIPNSTLVPFMGMGCSDARFFRERNIPTYGFSLIDPEIPLNELTDLVHGTNERVNVKTVDLSIKAYYNLAKEFLG